MLLDASPESIVFKLFTILCFILSGFVAGAILAWFYIHSMEKEQGDHPFQLEDIFANSAQRIADEKFHCEDYIGRSVGVVLANIFGSNYAGYLNAINQACFGNKCSISHSSCKPRQSDSCGSTVLYFELNTENQIDPLSFSCVQVP